MSGAKSTVRLLASGLPIHLFLVFQRRIIRGVNVTGLKG